MFLSDNFVNLTKWAFPDRSDLAARGVQGGRSDGESAEAPLPSGTPTFA